MVWLYILYYPLLNSLFVQPINGIGISYYTYIKSLQIESQMEIKGSPFKYYENSYITINTLKGGIRGFHCDLFDIYGGGCVDYTTIKMNEGKEKIISYGYYISLFKKFTNYGGVKVIYEKINDLSLWGISFYLRLY